MLVVLACSLDRDMDMHEMVQALYMLRYTCNTVVLAGNTGYLMCVLVVGISMWARSARYQRYGHIVRRATVASAIFLAVLVRYEWNADPMFSVVRLAVFVVTTRVSVTTYSMDSWDAALQAIWLFVVPAYAYLMVVFQVLSQYFVHRSSTTDGCLV